MVTTHDIRTKKLSTEEIDELIEQGKYLDFLYIHQTLLPRQIDRAIEKGEDLCFLYEHQKLSPRQIDNAIDRSDDLEELYAIYTCHCLSSRQKLRLVEKMTGRYKDKILSALDESEKAMYELNRRPMHELEPRDWELIEKSEDVVRQRVAFMKERDVVTAALLELPYIVKMIRERCRTECEYYRIRGRHEPNCLALELGMQVEDGTIDTRVG